MAFLANENFQKSSIWQKRIGKILLRCNRRDSAVTNWECPKGSENLKPGGGFLLGHSLPVTIRLHRALQPKTAKPRVGPCKGLCAPPPGQVASVHPQKVKTRCWGLCEPLSRGMVLPLKLQGQPRSQIQGRRTKAG